MVSWFQSDKRGSKHKFLKKAKNKKLKKMHNFFGGGFPGGFPGGMPGGGRRSNPNEKPEDKDVSVASRTFRDRKTHENQQIHRNCTKFWV